MQDYRVTMATVFRQCETWGNLVGLVACWGFALYFYSAGRSALAAGGHPPLALHAILDAAVQTATLYRMLDWASGLVELGLAGVLAVSAAEGTWWLARRLLPSAA